MGDPECQVILPRLKTDLFKIILASVNNQLKNIKINWKKNKCMTVVLCAKGYPGKYFKDKPIELKNIKKSKNLYIFHAGTKFENGKLLSSGGRVLNITCSGGSFLKIRKKIFKVIKKINWKYGFFRKDIGWRVI
jgi:phosphoribosylamine--glycine ligase